MPPERKTEVFVNFKAKFNKKSHKIQDGIKRNPKKWETAFAYCLLNRKYQFKFLRGSPFVLAELNFCFSKSQGLPQLKFVFICIIGVSDIFKNILEIPLMDKLFFFLFFASYQAFKHHRGLWIAFSKTGIKSEKNPKWLAYLQGFVALIFGVFISFLCIKILL